jgi:hypothetical protein
MTSAVEPVAERADVRTIVGGGAVLGLVTAVGVAVFALLSRALTGTVEVTAQSIVVLVGSLVAAFVPAHFVRPCNVDGIAWAALLGLVGSLFFTLVDVVALRPLGFYHWTWDAIGGGSGFWYIPVWWMGAATLAWLGAWIVAIHSRAAGDAGIVPAAVTTALLGMALYAIASLSGITPWHAATMALGVALALPLHVAVAAVRSRR